MDGIDGAEIKLNGRIAFHTEDNYFAYYESEGGYRLIKFIAAIIPTLAGLFAILSSLGWV